MGLPLPSLDNRTYAELVREGLRVLPRQAPRWTDHNAHDPGITLLELFAYLVEMDIFRLDRTPDAALRAFLRLVGIEPAPPRVAETVLELRPPPGTGPMAVAPGLRVSDAQGFRVFETDAAVHVADARLAAVASEAGGRRIDLGADNVASAEYRPLGPDPAVGDAFLLGFDAPLGAGGEPIALHVWSADPEGDAATRARLIAEWQRARAEAEASCGSGSGSLVPDWRQHYSARTLWEYLGPAGWSPLSGVDDETRGLSLSGFVRFPAPADAVPGALGPDLWTLRCRLVAGGYECPPAIRRVGLNAVRAVHGARTPQAEHLGISDGRADQSFDLAGRPAVAGSLELKVSLDGVADGPWREVPHWDRIGPHDRAFVLDPARARIVFGDGRIGRVPPAGARLACRYRVGGGSEGNLGAGSLVQAEGVAVSLRQPFAAFGGAPAETLDEARGRALDFLSERFRAVTLADLETLALATPGVPVARARAIAGHHPALPCVTAAGSVTLVAVPSCNPIRPGERPEAGPDFLSAVYRWLAPRCPLTTELHVVGPVFRAVAVEARLHADLVRTPVPTWTACRRRGRGPRPLSRPPRRGSGRHRLAPRPSRLPHRGHGRPERPPGGRLCGPGGSARRGRVPGELRRSGPLPHRAGRRGHPSHPRHPEETGPMTSLIAEEPLDRLNYFNGQRLEARDLRVEQDYHMRVRRLLNRALYTPGIASGLEVLPAANPHAVRVSPGVALDALGREVILLEETEVQVRGRPNTDPAWVYGNFLFLQYAEEPTVALTDGCALSSGRAELAWGGPTRIRAMPVLGFSDSWPDEGPDEGAGADPAGPGGAGRRLRGGADPQPGEEVCRFGPIGDSDHELRGGKGYR